MTTQGGFDRSPQGGFVRSQFGARNAAPSPVAITVGIRQMYVGSTNFESTLFNCYTPVGVGVRILSFTDSLSDLRVVFATPGDVISSNIVPFNTTPYAPLYANVTFNANLHTWLHAGGRLITNSEYRNSTIPPFPEAITPSDKIALNTWLTGLGASMQTGGGRYASLSTTGAGICSASRPVVLPLSSLLYCNSSSNIHLNGGMSLYDAPDTGSAADPDQPGNLCVAGIEKIGSGFLILIGDVDTLPALTGTGFNNWTLFRNLALFSNAQMNALV